MGLTLMGMTLAAGPTLALLAPALNGGARCLVDVMMNGSVAVHVNVDLRSCDLLGDFIEAIGGDGTIRERESNRRHDDAGKVNQRD